MKKLKNEDIKDLKEYNNILFKQGNKTSKNNPNKNLLLFKKEDISKNNLYLNNPKKVNSKLSNIVSTPLNNEHINEIKFLNNKLNKNQFRNRRKRPVSSFLLRNNSKKIPNTIKNSYSLVIQNKINRSLNESRKEYKLNLNQKCNKKKSFINEKIIIPPKVKHNQDKSIRFKFRLNNSVRNPLNENIRYANDNNINNSDLNNISSNKNTNININNLLIQEPKKDIFSSSFENIKSIRNLNIRLLHSSKNKNNKNIFKYNNFNSKSISNSQKNKIETLNYEKINKENNNNNSSSLIQYKNVYYSNIFKKGRNEIWTKLKKYNNDIRKKNDIKNIKYKSEDIENKSRRYYFYKYKEYMDKIQKEEINRFKYNQRKKKEINIREIFKDRTKSKNKNKTTEKSKIVFKDEFNEEFIQSNNSIIFDKSKSRSIDNNNNSNIFVRIPIKNSRKNLPKYNNLNDINKDESSSDEIPIIINNYEVKKSGIRKLRKNLTPRYFKKNYWIKRFGEENIIFETQSSYKSCPDTFTAEIKKLKEKDLLKFNHNLEKNKNKNKHNIQNIKTEKIKTSSINNYDKNKEKELFEVLKKNYFQRREKLLKDNRRNLLAQKLLIEKIDEIEKNNKNKYKKKFRPFYRLNYKYSKFAENENKKEIMEKYYRKNLDKNKFSVRLKNKSSMSLLSNNNSSFISYQFNFGQQYNEQKSDYFSINEFFNNENNKKNNDEKDKDYIRMDSTDNNFNFNEIKKIDDNIDFTENKKENEIIKKKEEELLKKKLDEERLNKMIKEQKKKKFENEFFKKYEKIIQAHLLKEKEKKELITNEILEEAGNNFFNLLKENEKIIQSSKNIEDAELFLEFREKMNSLEKFSKNELNLYIYRNYKTIINILEECKRDKKREIEINRFIKLLNDDLDEIYYKRKYIHKFMKVLDYKPFHKYTIGEN